MDPWEATLEKKGNNGFFCPICPYAKVILPKYLIAARQQGQNRFFFFFFFQRVSFNLGARWPVGAAHVNLLFIFFLRGSRTFPMAVQKCIGLKKKFNNSLIKDC